MTPPPYQQLKRVFQQALDQPQSKRADWLREACGGDEELRRQAEALLQAHETAGDFLEHPPVVDQDGPGVEEESLAPGTHVGQYEIRSELGRGGMGVVYLAEDRRLRRAVALKAVARGGADESLRERLRREARAAAAVAHPCIATVYALEEYDGQLFIASEYVPGPTLRQVLAAGRFDPARARTVALEYRPGAGGGPCGRRRPSRPQAREHRVDE